MNELPASDGPGRSQTLLHSLHVLILLIPPPTNQLSSSVTSHLVVFDRVTLRSGSYWRVRRLISHRFKKH